MRPTTGVRAARTIPAAAAGRVRIRSQQLFQRSEVTLLRSFHESSQKPLPLSCADRRAAPVRDVFSSATDELAHVGLLQLKNLGNMTVCIVERLSKNIGCPFGRRELLKQQKNRELQGLATFGSEVGVVAGDRVRKPGAHAGFMARAGRLRKINGQTCCCSGEESGGILNRTTVSCLPAQPYFLHNVLSFSRASQHAVCDAEQARAHTQEIGQHVVRILTWPIIMHECRLIVRIAVPVAGAALGVRDARVVVRPGQSTKRLARKSPPGSKLTLLSGSRRHRVSCRLTSRQTIKEQDQQLQTLAANWYDASCATKVHHSLVKFEVAENSRPRASAGTLGSELHRLEFFERHKRG